MINDLNLLRALSDYRTISEPFRNRLSSPPVFSRIWYRWKRSATDGGANKCKRTFFTGQVGRSDTEMEDLSNQILDYISRLAIF